MYVKDKQYIEKNNILKKIMYSRMGKTKFQLNYKYMDQEVNQLLMEKLDDDQLKDQVLYSITGDIMLEFYEVNDLQASSWIELPEKESVGYKFLNCYQLCFMGCLSSSIFG